MVMFIRHAEQVTLIVKMRFTAGLYQQKAVHRAAFGLQCRATGNQRVGLLRFRLHPLNDLFLRHRLLRRFHGKTGSKHLRQYNDVAPAHFFQLTIEMAQVGGTIHPHQRLLQQRNFQARHSGELHYKEGV
ncbi:hypothetical protein UA44_10695 [Klebsiella aerogenes]|nr:hypothetical protein UA44_10695 [Klebsiella aerogenes]